MPIRVLTKELVHDIIESYGQVTKLNLSTNEISRVENLECLTCLTKLNFFCNRLGPEPGCLDGLAPLTRLRELDVSDNSITTLRPLSLASVTLERLDASNNALALVDEVTHLAPLSALTELVLSGNSLSAEKGYRLRTLTVLPSLEALDHVPRQHRGSIEGGEGRGPNQRIEGSDAGDKASDDERAAPNLQLSLSDAKPDGAEIHVSDRSGAESVTSESQSNRVDEVTAKERSRAGIGDESQKRSEKGSGERSEEQASNVAISLQRGSVWHSFTAVQSGDMEPQVAAHAEERSTESVPAGLCARGSERSVSGSPFGDGPSVDSASGKAELAMPRLASRALSMADGLAPLPMTNAADPSQQTLCEDETLPAAERRFGGNCGGERVAKRELTTAVSLERLHGSSLEGVPAQTRASFVDRVPPSTPWGRERGSALLKRVVDEASPAEGTPNRDGVEGDGAMWWTGALPRGHGSQASTTAQQNAPDDALLQPSFSSRGLLESNQDALAMPGDGSYIPLSREVLSASSENLEEKQFGDSVGDALLSSSRQEGRPSRDPAFVVPASSATTPGGGRDALRRSAGGQPCWMGQSDAGVGGNPGSTKNFYSRDTTSCASEGRALFDVAPPQEQPVKNIWCRTSLDGVSGTGWNRGGDMEHRTVMESAAVVSEIVPEGNRRSSISAARAGIGTRREVGGGVVGNTVVIDRRELEVLRRENEDLRRQASLAEKRCTALSQMQRLADDAISKGQTSFSSPVPDQVIPSKHVGNPDTNRDVVGAGEVKQTGRFLGNSQKRSEERFPEGRDFEGDSTETPVGNAVSVLLACWRQEVLKILLERGAMAEASEENSRQAERRVLEARGAQSRAENEVKSLMQRALAAEAEAELLGIKLRKALEDLRTDRAERRTAEALSSGHVAAIRGLQHWMHSFVERASEGFFEREALLARGVAKLEAFSERLDLSAERLEMLGTLMQHKEVQLRNSRAALVADRRVWLLERQDIEMVAALGTNRASHVQPAAPDTKMFGGSKDLEVWCRREEMTRRWTPSKTELLEGLRPECEAVMRALFCRVDRLGTGAVRARRLLSVLRSDCGVSELMEAAVGANRWAAALDSMEEALCSSDPSCSGNQHIVSGSSGEISGERNVTWGEFLLFFLPRVGPADDAYNAGLFSPRGELGRCPHLSLTRGAALEGRGNRCGKIGVVSEDALAMLQMVVPQGWTARDPAEGRGIRRQRQVERGGFGSLSVGQLRREALRLARERAFMMALLREEGRLGRKRAEAVHDQYRHELRALHARVRELESSLGEVESRADGQRERADAVELEVCRLREELHQAEQAWKSRLDAVGKGKTAALEEASKEATRAETEARERFSRLEAEHALALRENGKASVRQRALERELSRIKTSLETEARLEKEALQERLREGESKLAIARRERNALLAALRDLQRQGRRDSCPRPSSASFDLETSGNGKAEPCFDDRGASATVENASFADDLVHAARAGDEVSEAFESREPGGSRREAEEARGGGAGRTASLTARLEVLALQTRQLLEEGSDTSCSGDDM